MPDVKRIPVTIVSARLAELEAIVQRGLEASLEAGAALMAIRDERLYRDTHETFDAYCRARWNMSRQHAYRLIAGAETSNHLSPRGDIKPTSEYQVRPIAGLTPKLQNQIFRRAVEEAEGKNPTARQVEEAKQTILKEMNDVKTLQPFVVIEKSPSLDKEIEKAVYDIFEKSQREMKRFQQKAGQEKFKTALLAILSEKLVPSKSLTAREAMRNWKRTIAGYILDNEAKREAEKT
jgi:hypothetical protein